MREFVTRAIEMLRRKGADYGDIRVVKRQSEQLEVKNGRTESVTADREEGFGVRVIVNGSWGFAAGSVLSEAELDRVVALAIEIGRASGKVAGEKVRLAPMKPEIATWTSVARRSPFEVPLADKLAMMLKADEGCAARRR